MRNLIIVHAHLPYFSRYNIFHFSSSNSFQTACRCLASFSPCIVSSPKQAAVTFTPTFISRQYSTLIQEVQYFLIRSLPHFVYIKHHLPINKQFSINSFLDWEGLCWDLAYHYLASIRLHFRSNASSTENANLHTKFQPSSF